MNWIALGVLMTVGLANVVLTLARAPVAARLAKTPQDVPRVAVSLAVTSFHLAMVAMSLFLTFITTVQVLYADPNPMVVIAPILGMMFFTYGYLMARYRSQYMGRLSHQQWIGGAAGETAELYAQAYRERAWIVGWAVAPLVLVLIARLVFFGALGTVNEMPAGMHWR